ncbi:hypothetical protein BJ322DRAFT_543194 [Thelephora terrestris]|uniref:Uncharacterized protein n=1 Tax=Thelephora terrestris TaxID=56493 RepID=A0A9P6HLM8_9AGAM|nr:hypothetical protein BJ322DRAFT_543194 [Thelephora terrestris]
MGRTVSASRRKVQSRIPGADIAHLPWRRRENGNLRKLRPYRGDLSRFGTAIGIVSLAIGRHNTGTLHYLHSWDVIHRRSKGYEKVSGPDFTILLTPCQSNGTPGGGTSSMMADPVVFFHRTLHSTVQWSYVSFLRNWIHATRYTNDRDTTISVK